MRLTSFCFLKKHLWFLALLLTAAACRLPQKTGKNRNKFTDQNLRAIYTLQDERNSVLLLPYLKNQDARYRREAALAFASIQDKNIVPDLEKLLTDPDPAVRQATAYALGQTGSEQAEGALLKAIDTESRSWVKAEILEALGRCGTDKGLSMVANLNSSDSVLQAGQAWAFYRAILTHPLPEAAIKQTVYLLENGKSREVKIAASQTLARSGKTNLTPYAGQLLNALNTIALPQIRSAIATALGKTRTNESTGKLNELALTDADYRVRLNAIRAMKDHDYPVYRATLFKALNDKDPNVRLAAAELLGSKNLEDATVFRQAAGTQLDWRTRAQLYGNALASAAAREELRNEIIFRYRSSVNRYEKGALLTALGNDPGTYDFLVGETFKAQDPVISTYGIEALMAMRKNRNFPETQREAFAQMLQKAIANPDVAIIGTAATTLRDPQFNFRDAYPNYNFLKEAQVRLTLPRDIEPYLELQKTIAYFYSIPEPETPKAKSNPHPINWELIQRIKPNQKVAIRTSKGLITMQLFVNDAPGSVANFVELLEQGFYTDKYFHRVVPNFVAQAGCPRGDGWGGTDYNIRSEFADLHYEEGSVGLASAGKDTESCQWFITHTRTPHLDGRYTIFAKVISGMDVVHNMQIGDKIERIDLVN